MERNKSQDFPKSRKALKMIRRVPLILSSAVFLCVCLPEWWVPVSNNPVI